MTSPKAMAWALCLCALAMAGCHQDMWNQPRYKPLAHSSFFDNGSASRMPGEGTVQYKQPRTDEQLYTGKINGTFAENFPFAVTREVLERGQERFNITCTPCHGLLGDGKGMITQRGFPAPPSYHIDRLREVPPGYFFDVMTNGFGRMYSYASRVTPEDRWAIAAYIRTLQLSQNMPFAELDPSTQGYVQHPETAPHAADAGHGEAHGAESASASTEAHH